MTTETPSDAAPVGGTLGDDPSGPIPQRLLPDTAELTGHGHLRIGGCDLVDLAAEFGTPLFVYDEAHLRARCRGAVGAFDGGAAYAAKAFLCAAMARLAISEGMDIDVASGASCRRSCEHSMVRWRSALCCTATTSQSRSWRWLAKQVWAASWSTLLPSWTVSTSCTVPMGQYRGSCCV